MPSNHLILCHPLFLLPSIFPSIRVFSNESVLHIRWPKYWSFSISPSNEYSGLISFRMGWLGLLVVQGTVESSPTPQFKSINSSALSFLYTADLSLGLTSPSNTGHNLTRRRLDYYASSQSVCWESTVSGPCEHQALFSLILLDVFRPQLWLFSSHACADLCSAKSSKEALLQSSGIFFFLSVQRSLPS